MSLPIGPCETPIECADATRAHLRGSNLLLLGRMISLGINLLVNVAIVRYLSKDDYGAFSYGLAIAAFGANVLLLGMPRAVGRFAPFHHERGDRGAVLGTLILSTALVAGLGALGLALLHFVAEPAAARWVTDPLALQLTRVLIVLAPLTALDSLFESMLAAFARTGALFVRRFLLGPLLRLAAVVGVALSSGDVLALSLAYLAASLLGLVACGLLLVRSLRESGLLTRIAPSELRFQAREILGYGLPLVVTDAMVAVRAPLAVVLLEMLRDTREIADLNAFLKISGLNLIVLQSMRQLFLPIVSRMLARGEDDSIDDIYWKTTIWISLLTFPIFLPCLVMPDVLALVINGPGYVASSGVLVVLALGDFVNAAMGPNGQTLNAYDRVRFMVWTTSLATLIGALLTWLLIPELGALGAAAGVSVSIIVQNGLHHWGLHRFTSVGALRPRYAAVYASQIAVVLGMLALDAWIGLHPVAGGALVVASALALVRRHRETMNLADVLPEVARVPVLGRFLLPRLATGAARRGMVANEQGRAP